MSRFLDVARTAALAGGYIVRERAGRVGDSWHKSGPTDLVTDVDIAAGVAVGVAGADHHVAGDARKRIDVTDSHWING